MTAKEKILNALRAGALSDAEIAVLLKMPTPSIRRSRGELLIAKAIEANAPHADGSMTWVLASHNAVPKKRTAVTDAAYGPKSAPPETRPAPGNIVHF